MNRATFEFENVYEADLFAKEFQDAGFEVEARGLQVFIQSGRTMVSDTLEFCEALQAAEEVLAW
jgi:hypothetical protein